MASKKKLWFDPKNPPKTPVFVGQRIPIYIVPDDTKEDDRLVEPTWRKTDWVFRVVGIRKIIRQDDDGNNIEDEVVDVEWPNKHIDRNIPIQTMYGHFARLCESWVPQFTEEYVSEEEEEIIDLSKAHTNQEKLEQLLKLLQFLSEQREHLRQSEEEEVESVVTIEETTDAPTIVEKTVPVVDSDDSESTSTTTAGPSREAVEGWFRSPAKGGLRIKELRQKASELGIEGVEELKKAELKKKLFEQFI
jgi:hypothetical protein